MIQSMTRIWWVLALRGAAAIVFGLLAFASPNLSLAALIALFGAYALADGVIYLAAAPAAGGTSALWWMLLDGLLGIAAGTLTFLYPVAVAVILLFLLGGWLLFSGLLRIGLAVELRKEIPNERLLALSGVASVIAGGLIFYAPGASLIAWVWVIGAYALLYGCIMLAAGFQLKKLTHNLASSPQTLAR